MGRHELWAELMKLTPAERVALVEDLWDSIARDSLPPLSAEELDETDRDLALHRKNPAGSQPWDVVRTRLRSRH